MRLTKAVVQKIPDMNEGFTRTTSYTGKNYRADCSYLVKGGKLLIGKTGKTSWADSRFDISGIADIDQARRFIRKFIDSMKTDGLE